MALEGRFLFLGNLAEAYFHMTSGFVYFEYWFPSAWWTGIAASDQIISDVPNNCLDCYFENGGNQNGLIANCLDECVGNNLFEITAEGDPDPQLSWEVIEAILVNTLNDSQFDQYQLPSILNELTPYDIEV